MRTPVRVPCRDEPHSIDPQGSILRRLLGRLASAAPAPTTAPAILGGLATLLSLLPRCGGLFVPRIRTSGVIPLPIGFFPIPSFVIQGLRNLSTFFVSPGLLLMARVLLVGLMAALLLGALMKRRDKVLEGPDKMGAEVALGFVGLLDRLGDILDGGRQAFQRGMDSLEAGGDAFEMLVEKLGLPVGVGSAHDEWWEL